MGLHNSSHAPCRVAAALHPERGMKAFWTLTLTLFLLGALSSLADAKPVRLLVSVGELGPNADLSWQREACSLIHQIGNQVVSAGLQVSCRQDSIHVIDTYLQQLKTDNSYHIRLLRGYKGSYRVSVSNWNRSLDSDFGSLSWNIGREPSRPSLREDGLNAVLANFFLYLEEEELLKTQWLIMARNHSKSITFDFRHLRFKSRKDGKFLSVEAAARLFEKESTQNAEYLRSHQEIALAFTTMSPADLNYFKPEGSLRILLEKAAREGQRAATYWRHVVKFDDRGASGLTLELINTVGKEALPPRNQSATINPPLRQALKPLGKLIYLF